MIQPGQNMFPTVVKNLLIINGLAYLALIIFLNNFNTNLNWHLGLFYFDSPRFEPYQLVTHMFMHSHAGLGHIFMNMFALWMFGSMLENIWGPKRFLIYYMLTGLGAAFLHQAAIAFDVYNLIGQLTVTSEAFSQSGGTVSMGTQYFPNLGQEDARSLLNLYFSPAVGASGAVFGILLAYGMLFPNNVILLFLVIPLKAKYFVMIYGAISLYFAMANVPGDNVAHFAHLGGMLFGFLILMYWKRKGTMY